MVRRSKRGPTSGIPYSLLVCYLEAQVLRAFQESRRDALRMMKSSHILFDWSRFRGSEVRHRIVDGVSESILHSASIICTQHYSMFSNR